MKFDGLDGEYAIIPKQEMVVNLCGKCHFLKGGECTLPEECMTDIGEQYIMVTGEDTP